MGRTIPATLFVASTAVVLATPPAAAKEYYVGEPVAQSDMKIVPHYLLGIEMAPMPKGAAMGPNAVHLEVAPAPTSDRRVPAAESRSLDRFHSPFNPYARPGDGNNDGLSRDPNECNKGCIDGHSG